MQAESRRESNDHREGKSDTDLVRIGLRVEYLYKTNK